MSVLTKVFVVLVTVLSVMLVALVVPFVANTKNYKDEADTLQSKLQVSEANAQALGSQLTSLNEGAAKRAAEYESQSSQLRQEIADRDSRLASLNDAVNAEKARGLKLEANASRINAANEQLLVMIQQKDTELAQRRTKGIAAQTSIIALEQRNNELEAEKAGAIRALKNVREQLAQLEESKNELLALWNKVSEKDKAAILAGSGDSSKSASEGIWAASPILGKVTGVEVVSDDTFVKINVGEDDGVQKDMLFLVHRGEEYLGTLIITVVDEKEAAGQMKLQSGTINAGDQIATGTK